MGNRILRWYTILVILLMLAAVLLPCGMHIQQVQENRVLLKKMEQRLATFGEEEIKQRRNLARWYNYGLDFGISEQETAYGNLLNLGDGAMAVLEVPELRIQQPIFHGGEGNVGHLAESHIPIGGRGLHTVLRVKAQYNWQEGMAVYIDCLGERIPYRVESVQVMPAGWPTEWPAEEARLTILYDRGRQRTIVRCIRCSELTVRRWEKKAYFPDGVLAAMMAFFPVILAFLHKRWKHMGYGRQKYHGFFRKNSRKSELL